MIIFFIADIPLTAVKIVVHPTQTIPKKIATLFRPEMHPRWVSLLLLRAFMRRNYDEN